MAGEQYEIYESGTAAALAEWQLAALAEKPDGTAYAPDLTAGAALGITGEATESAAWLQRVSTSDGPTTIRSIKGNTLVWNQLVASPFGPAGTQQGVTFTANADGSMTAQGTVPSDGGSLFKPLLDGNGATIKGVAGHKFLIKANYSGSGAESGSIYGGGGPITGPNMADAIGTATNANEFYLRITAGATVDFTVHPQLFDLTAMFGAGSEPSTIEEFNSLYPLPYYTYNAGSLLSVNIEGVESTGKNLLPNAVASGAYGGITVTANHDGSFTCNGSVPSGGSSTWIPISQGFEVDSPSVLSGCPAGGSADTYFIQAAKVGASTKYDTGNGVQLDAGMYAIYACIKLGITVSNKTFCPQLERGASKTSYEPYAVSEHTIPVADYFPNGMRSAGSVYDELTETERIVRVGERAYQSGDESDPTVTTDGTITYYPLATPTVTPHEQPLNMTYRTAAGGTERVMVPTGENSAPPTIVAAQGYTAESLRDAALSAIAPVENGKASTNYGIGSYLVHGGQLCKVTTAIATGEAITIGTNVTATTVMAEVIALIAQ